MMQLESVLVDRGCRGGRVILLSNFLNIQTTQCTDGRVILLSNSLNIQTTQCTDGRVILLSNSLNIQTTQCTDGRVILLSNSLNIQTTQCRHINANMEHWSNQLTSFPQKKYGLYKYTRGTLLYSEPLTFFPGP
jgi:hypothetical protein